MTRFVARTKMFALTTIKAASNSTIGKRVSARAHFFVSYFWPPSPLQSQNVVTKINERKTRIAIELITANSAKATISVFYSYAPIPFGTKRRRRRFRLRLTARSRFSFGPRAAVFCPIYSERCRMTPPEHSISPLTTPRSPMMPPLCGHYRTLATSYCGNQFALLYPSVRDGCDKYVRANSRRFSSLL